jgi:MscS family membrane protein
VGWGQTRIRGTDTRPTYIPNSHFALAAVTNLERISHRKFEAVVPVRFEDFSAVPAVIERLRERLRTLPKLDAQSMPFRVNFVRVGAYR